MRHQRCPLNTFSISDIRNLSIRDPAGRIRISIQPCQTLTDCPACYLGISTGYVLVTFRFYPYTDYYTFTNPFFSYSTITKPQTSGFGTNLGLKPKKIESVLPQSPLRYLFSSVRSRSLYASACSADLAMPCSG
jgi:hypothetical protein